MYGETEMSHKNPQEAAGQFVYILDPFMRQTCIQCATSFHHMCDFLLDKGVFIESEHFDLTDLVEMIINRLQKANHNI